MCPRAISTTSRPGRTSTACMNRSVITRNPPGAAGGAAAGIARPAAARGRRAARPYAGDGGRGTPRSALSETSAKPTSPWNGSSPALHAGISRPDLVSHTKQLAERIAARIKHLPRAGATVAPTTSSGVPDRRFGATRPCPQGHHEGGAGGPHRRRRHLRRRRQGTDAGGAAALRAARLARYRAENCGDLKSRYSLRACDMS